METGRLINKLSNCLRRRSAAIQKTAGLGGTQGAILDYILIESLSRHVCQRDIEQEFGLRPASATGLLKALEQDKLITRTPDPVDSRRKNITFTPEAAHIREILREEINDTEQLMISGISPEELEQFMRIGRRMLENLTSSTERSTSL